MSNVPNWFVDCMRADVRRAVDFGQGREEKVLELMKENGLAGDADIQDVERAVSDLKRANLDDASRKIAKSLYEQTDMQDGSVSMSDLDADSAKVVADGAGSVFSRLNQSATFYFSLSLINAFLMGQSLGNDLRVAVHGAILVICIMIYAQIQFEVSIKLED